MIIGVDPGLSGAVATLILHAKYLSISDMPTFELTRNGKKKREIDCSHLAGIFEGDCVPDVWLEQVGAMPGQGTSSMFAFGQTVGIIKGIVATLQYPLHLVTPQVWKKALKVPADKDGARLVASRLMPWAADEWLLKKHDGRAEAALIAYYGSMHVYPVNTHR